MTFERGCDTLSTKIYSGYLLASEVNPHEFCRALRTKIVPIIQEQISTLIYSDAVKKYDIYTFTDGKNSPEKCESMESALAKTYKEYLLAKPLKHHIYRDLDSEYSPTIYMGQHPQTLENYLYIAEKGDTVKTILDSSPEVSDYSYWNNTDRPQEITQEQWDKRREDWDAVLGDNWGLDQSMFSFKPVSSFEISGLTLNEIKEKRRLPQLEQRRSWLRQHIAIQEVFSAADENDSPQEKMEKAFSAAFSPQLSAELEQRIATYTFEEIAVETK